jgi:hypothetical protein
MELAQKVELFQSLKQHLWEKTELGTTARAMLQDLQQDAVPLIEANRELNPLAFVTLSWEQALKCNAWVWGTSFYCDFDANRIGKTAGTIFNASLWMFPNDPTWNIFQPYTDHAGRHVQVLRRPSMKTVKKIREFFLSLPPSEYARIPIGNPKKQPYDPENAEALAFILSRFDLTPLNPKVKQRKRAQNEENTTTSDENESETQTFKLPFNPNPDLNELEIATLKLPRRQFPPEIPTIDPEMEYSLEAPVAGPRNVMWIGAPDWETYHRNIIMPAWRKWLPKDAIIEDSEHNHRIVLKINECKWTILFKSYDAKDTKWSGDAVAGINLTEGVPHKIFNEVRQRFTPTGFGAWDYTPYESRNTGANANLAYNVFKGKEKLPLRAFVFTGFGIENTPTYILDESKRKEMVEMWAGKAEGEARIKGMFFSSSPLVLNHLDREFHCLPITYAKLKEIRPNLLQFRGLDPGYDHPTACVWMALSPSNEWFVYRFYKKRGTTISERCSDIIRLSGNSQKPHPQYPHIKREIHLTPGRQPSAANNQNVQTCPSKSYAFSSRDLMAMLEEEFEDDSTLNQVWPEQINTSQIPPPPSDRSEVFVATLLDYHTFKTDEATGLPVANHFINQGLVVTPSPMTRPKDRGILVNAALETSHALVHPLTKKSPGCRLYFLIGEDNGVNELVEDLEQLFWDRISTGDRAGEPKDEMQATGDDGFDALSYPVCSTYRYMPMNLHKITS